MIEKLKNIVDGDGLFFQKAGLILGAVVGVLIGFVVSDRADKSVIETYEEVDDGPETD